jgi:hypothetical protein
MIHMLLELDGCQERRAGSPDRASTRCRTGHLSPSNCGRDDTDHDREPSDSETPIEHHNV